MALKSWKEEGGILYKDKSQGKMFKSQGDYEEIEKAERKKPVRHIRMRGGKPVYAGSGVAKPKEPEVDSDKFMPGTKIPKVKVQLVGQDGNAFAIMGRVRHAMQRARVPQEVIDRYLKESKLGDYDHLLQTAMAYTDDTGEDVEEPEETDSFEKAKLPQEEPKYGYGERLAPVQVTPKTGIPFMRQQKVGRKGSNIQREHETTVKKQNLDAARKFLDEQFSEGIATDDDVRALVAKVGPGLNPDEALMILTEANANRTKDWMRAELNEKIQEIGKQLEVSIKEVCKGKYGMEVANTRFWNSGGGNSYLEIGVDSRPNYGNSSWYHCDLSAGTESYKDKRVQFRGASIGGYGSTTEPYYYKLGVLHGKISEEVLEHQATEKQTPGYSYTSPLMSEGILSSFLNAAQAVKDLEIEYDKKMYPDRPGS